MCTFFVGDIVLEKIYELLVLESEKASIEGEVPISAIIVKGQQILSVTHNLKEKLNDVTAHAEILAIQEASMLVWNLVVCVPLQFINLELIIFIILLKEIVNLLIINY